MASNRYDAPSSNHHESPTAEDILGSMVFPRDAFGTTSVTAGGNGYTQEIAVFPTSPTDTTSAGPSSPAKFRQLTAAETWGPQGSKAGGSQPRGYSSPQRSLSPSAGPSHEPRALPSDDPDGGPSPPLGLYRHQTLESLSSVAQADNSGRWARAAVNGGDYNEVVSAFNSNVGVSASLASSTGFGAGAAGGPGPGTRVRGLISPCSEVTGQGCGEAKEEGGASRGDTRSRGACAGEKLRY